VCNCYSLTEVQVFVAGDTTNDIEMLRIHPRAICVPNFDDELDGGPGIVRADSVSPQYVRGVSAGIDHFSSPRGVPE
jgi:sucrose-phosphate synthase